MVVTIFRTAKPAWQRPISEAKQGWAWLVLGWETAWEYQVLYAFLECVSQILHETHLN